MYIWVLFIKCFILPPIDQEIKNQKQCAMPKKITYLTVKEGLRKQVDMSCVRNPTISDQKLVKGFLYTIFETYHKILFRIDDKTRNTSQLT